MADLRGSHMGKAEVRDDPKISVLRDGNTVKIPKVGGANNLGKQAVAGLGYVESEVPEKQDVEYSAITDVEFGAQEGQHWGWLGVICLWHLK